MIDAQGASPAPPVPAGFDLLRPLGTGATSVVWAATCVALGDVVALKWAVTGSDEDLAGEADRLRQVDDPHVLRCYDLVQGPDGRAVLVLELAAGGSLADRLTAAGPLDPGEVARIGAGVAAGLGALHGAGLVHRDVKPSNVLLGDGDRPLLADLSAARPVTEPGPDVTGTGAYLDPRVLAGAAPDPAADIWALGATLFEALCGHPPTGLAEARWPDAHPPAIHSLRAVVDRCLAPSPAGRPSAASLAEGLAGLAAAADLLPPPHVPVPLLGAAGAEGHDRGATRTFGPRPPAPPAAPQPTRPPSPLLALGAAVLTVAALASPLSPLRSRAVAGAVRSCPPLEVGRGVVAADLDGDGCPSALRWDGRVLVVPGDGDGGAPARYAIGRPGDTLVFGDWDCDGADTPALHRPRTGEVIRFDHLPEPGVPLDGAVRTGPPGASVAVGVGSDGCDEVRTG